MIRTLAFAGAAALLVAAVAPASAQYRPGPPPGGPSSQYRSGAAPEGPSDEFRNEDTQRFVISAAQSDEFERRAGRLAQSMGVSNRVREFGAMMVQDHTRTTQDLQAAIRRTNHTPPPPPPLRPDQQRMLDELRGAARGFDFIYLRQQVQAHEEALNLMQTYASTGRNAVLRDAARQTAPLVRHHLEMAQRLQANVRR